MPAAQKTNSKGTLKTETLVDQSVQTVRPEPLKTLLSWKAPERVFKKRSREFFTTIGAIVFLVIVILLFVQEWLLIVVSIALTFYAYIVSTVEPGEAEHRLTNRGIVTGGQSYFWQGLGRFWFDEKWGQKVLYVENLIRLPQRLTLLLGSTEEKKVKEILSAYLLHEEPEKTWTDKASDWLSRHIPLE